MTAFVRGIIFNASYGGSLINKMRKQSALLAAVLLLALQVSSQVAKCPSGSVQAISGNSNVKQTPSLSPAREKCPSSMALIFNAIITPSLLPLAVLLGLP